MSLCLDSVLIKEVSLFQGCDPYRGVSLMVCRLCDMVMIRYTPQTACEPLKVGRESSHTSK